MGTINSPGTRSRGLGVSILATALAFTTVGCGPSYRDLPLPGTSVPGDTYEVKAEFADALNLTTGADVKLNGAAVGKVEEIRVEDGHAVADLTLQRDVVLTSSSSARLRYDTPLGEVFVQLTQGKGGSRMRDGGTLPLTRTSTAATVEDTMAQASLLVNGGGLAELSTITRELNNAVGGRESDFTSAAHELESFLDGLNDSSAAVNTVLVELARASKTIRQRRASIRNALRELGPAADVLSANTRPLMQLLARSDALTRRANRILQTSQGDLIQVLAQLGPILQEVLAAEPDLLYGYEHLPQADKLLLRAIPGDYIPLELNLSLDLQRLLLGPQYASGSGPGGGSQAGQSPAGSTGGLLGLLGIGTQKTQAAPWTMLEGPLGSLAGTSKGGTP